MGVTILNKMNFFICPISFLTEFSVNIYKQNQKTKGILPFIYCERKL